MGDTESTRSCTSRIPTIFVVHAINLVLSLALIGSGLLHLQNVTQFYLAIANYDLPLRLFTRQVALAFPWLSIVSGVFMLNPQTRFVGSLLASGLFLTFTIAQASALLRGLEIGCGCLPG